MKSVALSVVCLWGVVCLCASMDSFSLKEDALKFTGILPCGNWDCECAFNRERGCCCASNQMCALEGATFKRMVELWGQLTQLHDEVQEITGTGTHIAFTAAMSSRVKCFGPFNTNVSIPYDSVAFNQGYGYNPALGVFTAPRAGLYVFSFTAYSKVEGIDARLYHKVQMMLNGKVLTSMWEDNREDSEDSGSQVLLVSLERGSQVYMELLNGRSLCGNTEEFNMFSGYLLYPSIEK